jgi:hypothetical protein
MPIVSCKKCANNFYAKPSHVVRGWGKYCSAACSHSSMRTGRNVSCQVCNKRVYRTLKNFRVTESGNFFCSKSCFALWKNQNLLIGERNGNWKDGQNAYRSMLKRTKIVPKCSDCGISDTRVLVAHHIDRNRKNNVLSNLKWLCRNCHYIEHKGKTV